MWVNGVRIRSLILTIILVIGCGDGEDTKRPGTDTSEPRLADPDDAEETDLDDGPGDGDDTAGPEYPPVDSGSPDEIDSWFAKA